MQHQIVNEKLETDALFDTSPRAMAERFGARARQLIYRGENPREAARLAASYAFLVDPSLRIEPPASTLTELLVRLGTQLNLTTRDRIVILGFTAHGRRIH